jgi:hypothetical protein
MSTLAQLESAILALPQDSFLQLVERLCARRDGLVYESPELETELLKAADGPWHPVGETLYEDIRNAWREKNKAGTKTLQTC